MTTMTIPDGKDEVMVDNARDPRIDRPFKVSYQFGDSIRVGKILNLSRGGVFVRTLSPPPVGTSLLLHLYLQDDGEPIHLPAQVIWTRPGEGFGVKFGYTMGFARVALERIVKEIPQPAREISILH